MCAVCVYKTPGTHLIFPLSDTLWNSYSALWCNTIWEFVLVWKTIRIKWWIMMAISRSVASKSFGETLALIFWLFVCGYSMNIWNQIEGWLGAMLFLMSGTKSLVRHGLSGENNRSNIVGRECYYLLTLFPRINTLIKGPEYFMAYDNSQAFYLLTVSNVWNHRDF